MTGAAELKQMTPRTAGNERTGFLKTLALIFMVIDHAAILFFKNDLSLRTVGRIAFPLYAWCMAVGMSYTGSPLRYALRLAVMAAVTQVPYVFVMGHGWLELNVLATLLLGQLAIWGIREHRYGSAVWAPLMCLAVTLFVKVDYDWRGVLFIILLYLARGSRQSLIAVMIAYCLFWGEGTMQVDEFFGIDLSWLKGAWAPYAFNMFRHLLRVQALAIAALPFMLLPVGFKGRMPRWLGYLVYPGHMLLLGLIKLLIGA